MMEPVPKQRCQGLPELFPPILPPHLSYSQHLALCLGSALPHRLLQGTENAFLPSPLPQCLRNLRHQLLFPLCTSIRKAKWEPRLFPSLLSAPWGTKSGRSVFLLFPVNRKPGKPVPLPCVRKGGRNRWGGRPCRHPRGGKGASPSGEDVAAVGVCAIRSKP